MVNFSEAANLHGKLEVKVFKSGKLVDSFVEDNLIVNGARTQMSHLIAGDFSGRKVSQIAFGTSGTEPTVDNQTITNPFVKNINAASYPTATSVKFDWDLGTSEDNGAAIMEFGLLCDDGTLFSRRVRTNPINKADDISIEGHWTISF
jgi:hypothetical protein